MVCCKVLFSHRRRGGAQRPGQRPRDWFLIGPAAKCFAAGIPQRMGVPRRAGARRFLVLGAICLQAVPPQCSPSHGAASGHRCLLWNLHTAAAHSAFHPGQCALGFVATASATGAAPGVCVVRPTRSRHSHHPWHGDPHAGIRRTTSCARSWPRMPWPAPDCRGHRPLAKSCGPATESPHLHPESHRGTDLAARPGCAPALGV